MISDEQVIAAQNILVDIFDGYYSPIYHERIREALEAAEKINTDQTMESYNEALRASYDKGYADGLKDGSCKCD